MGDRKVFTDSVIPLPDEPGPAHGLSVEAAEPDNRDEKMTVLFALEIPAEVQAELEQRVARGEVVPADELQQKYTADAADRQKLLDWLKAQHFDVTDVYPDGVYARAKVGQIENSLDVDMVRVNKEGQTYTAAKNAPSLPADVANSVQAIIGLQPFRKLGKHSRILAPDKGAAAATGEPAAAVATPPPGYHVPEILAAYGADKLTVTGQGQTIAILIDKLPHDSDLQKFWSANGVPTSLARIEKVNVNNLDPAKLEPTAGESPEETLDASWASGIAPGATVRIYACGDLALVDLDKGLDRIIDDQRSRPDMRQLSISLGLGELFLTPDEIRTETQKFLRLAAAGVNVFVSSGDNGSRPPPPPGVPVPPITQPGFASSHPFVIAVGGTVLTLTPGGTVASEVGWEGSGGGESRIFLLQPWQKGAGMPGLFANRLVPDVSLVAGYPGAFLVFNDQVKPVGGTSWSAPVWAGFCALINEARAKANKPLLPYLGPLLYPLMGTACFRDITAGNNGDYLAAPGYDLVTGIGVPNVAELIKALTTSSG